MVEGIAKAVREARTNAGLSTEALSTRANVPSDVLARFEAGQAGLTTTQLASLAEALEVDPSALLAVRVEARPVASVFLRHGPLQDFHPTDHAVAAYALEQARTLLDLRRVLGLPAGPLQAAVFAPAGTRASHAAAPALHGYELAQRVRAWMGRPTEPFADLGWEIEDRFAIAVLVRPFSSSRVTAIGVRAQDAAAVVLEDADPERARNPLLGRVYLAHELCHLLFDPSEGGVHLVVEQTDARGLTVDEQRARAFAAELLLPEAGLEALLGAPRSVDAPMMAMDLIQTARAHFGTPHPITANHLCNRGFVDARLREWLEAGTTTLPAPPPLGLPGRDEPSRWVADGTRRAWAAGLITDAEARGALGLDSLVPLPWDEGG